MPFLDDLILGKPEGDRRRKYMTRMGHAPDLGGGMKAGTLPSTMAMLQRRSASHEAGDEEGLEDRRPCGNPACSKNWTLPWKRRNRPVLDGQWACSRGCLLAMAKTALTRETGDGVFEDGQEPHHHRVPLGLVMLAQGWITHSELQRALEAQRLHGRGRIGEWLVSQCGMKPERIARGLSAQWNCPVLSIEGLWPEAMALTLPRVFLEEYGAVPLRVAGRKVLYVGFRDALDASASFALERMTGLKAESGMLPETEFVRARETLLRCEFPRQSVSTAGDRDGLARAIAETLEHEQPEASRLVRLHRYYWLRVWAKGDVERAAGDLPSHANGVRDYLFTIGSRMAHPVHDEMNPQQAFVPERVRAVEEMIYAAAAVNSPDEPRAATGKDVDEGFASASKETPQDGSGVIDDESFATAHEEYLTGNAVADEMPFVAESHGVMDVSTSDQQVASVYEEPPASNLLTTRDSRLDRGAKAGYVGPQKELRHDKGELSLQGSMRARMLDLVEIGALETIDGEYLPVETMIAASTTLVPANRSTGWNGFGLLKRLMQSSPGRGHDPDLGPGQGV